MTQSDQPNDVRLPAMNPTASESLEEYYRRGLENIRRRLPSAMQALKAVGIVRVVVAYDGCGDSGQIENIDYFGPDEARLDPAGKARLSEHELMDLFYDLTQLRHPGWENNDGAWGNFVWDLTTDTLHHTHNALITDYDTTEHEGL